MNSNCSDSFDKNIHLLHKLNSYLEKDLNVERSYTEQSNKQISDKNTTDKIIDIVMNVNDAVANKNNVNHVICDLDEQYQNISKNVNHALKLVDTVRCSYLDTDKNISKIFDIINDIKLEQIKLKKLIDFGNKYDLHNNFIEFEKKIILHERDIQIIFNKIEQYKCVTPKIDVKSHESVSESTNSKSSHKTNKSEVNNKIIELVSKYHSDTKNLISKCKEDLNCAIKNVDEKNSKKILDLITEISKYSKSDNNVHLENELKALKRWLSEIDIKIQNTTGDNKCENLKNEIDVIKKWSLDINAKIQNIYLVNEKINEIKNDFEFIKKEIEKIKNTEIKTTVMCNINSAILNSEISIPCITEQIIPTKIIENHGHKLIIAQLACQQIIIKKNIGIINITGINNINCDIVGNIQIFHNDLGCIYEGIITNKHNCVDTNGQIVYILSNRPIISMCLNFSGFIKIEIKYI